MVTHPMQWSQEVFTVYHGFPIIDAVPRVVMESGAQHDEQDVYFAVKTGNSLFPL